MGRSGYVTEIGVVKMPSGGNEGVTNFVRNGAARCDWRSQGAGPFCVAARVPVRLRERVRFPGSHPVSGEIGEILVSFAKKSRNVA